MFMGKIKEIKIPKKYNVLIKSKSKDAEIKEKIVKEIKEEILEKKKRIMPKEKEVKSQKERFNDALWYAKIAKTNVDERKMRKMLSKEFNRQERQVLNSLREKSFTFNFDVDEEKKIFIKLFTPFFKDLVEVYGEDAIEMVGASGFSLSDRAKDWISKNVKNFAGEVNKTTQNKIRDALAKAVEEGEGIPEASRRIKSVFTSANTSRARAIARTEILHSSNFASVEAWKQSDVVKKKEWYTALDERVCPICEPMHGKVKPLANEFSPGDKLFGNVDEPPAHVSCRCTLLPVLKTKSNIINEIKEQKDEFKKTIQETKKESQKEIKEIQETKEKLNKVLEDG